MGTSKTTVGSFGPIEPQERVILLDVLRGFAVLGILFVTSTDNAGLYFPNVLFSATLDRLGYNLVYILGKAKFWPLFALLMGVGFAIQLERAEARKVNIIPTYLRRLFFLAAMGIFLLSFTIRVHQLLNLAIAGVLMLFIGYALRRRPLYWLGIVVLIVFVVQLSFGISESIARDRGLYGPPDVSPNEASVRIEEFKARREVLADAPRASLVRSWPSNELLRMLKVIVGLFTPKSMLRLWLKSPYIFFMLVGIFLWRLGVFRDIKRHRRFYVTLLAVSLPIGLSSAIHFYLVSQSWRLTNFGLGEYPTFFNRLTYQPLFIASTLGMVFTYIAGIALLMQRKNWARVLGIFAPVGRMALTNYALQDIFPALVFGAYFVGISRFKISFLAHGSLLLVIFCLQILFSRVWLRAYRFGPLEWLWRTLTYWKFQPMRLRREPSEEKKRQLGMELKPKERADR
jgi:uncharacterized protein